MNGLLDQGESSAVYAARQRLTGYPVALHLVSGALSRQATFGSRLGVAARRMASLQNPHIAAVYDVVIEGGNAWVVGELVEGRTLSALARRGPLPAASVAAAADDVLAALEAAHRAGVVHGDVRAEQVWVDREGRCVLDGFAVSMARAAGGSGAPRETGAGTGEPAEGAARDILDTAAMARSLLARADAGAAAGEHGAAAAALDEALAAATGEDPARRPSSATQLRARLQGAATTVLGPGWRLGSDLADRVTAAEGAAPATGSAASPGGAESETPSVGDVEAETGEAPQAPAGSARAEGRSDAATEGEAESVAAGTAAANGAPAARPETPAGPPAPDDAGSPEEPPEGALAPAGEVAGHPVGAGDAPGPGDPAAGDEPAAPTGAGADATGAEAGPGPVPAEQSVCEEPGVVPYAAAAATTAAAAAMAAGDAEGAQIATPSPPGPPAGGRVPGFSSPPPPGTHAGARAVPAAAAGAAAREALGPEQAPWPGPMPWEQPAPRHFAPSPAPPQRRRRRGRIAVIALLVAVLAAGGAVAALAATGVIGGSGNNGPLVVGGDVTLTAVPPQGGCGSTFHFIARGSVHGVGTLVYRFERSDGGQTQNVSVPITSDDASFEFTNDWRFIGARTVDASMTFRIISPTERSAQSTVHYACAGG